MLFDNIETSPCKLPFKINDKLHSLSIQFLKSRSIRIPEHNIDNWSVTLSLYFTINKDIQWFYRISDYSKSHHVLKFITI